MIIYGGTNAQIEQQLTCDHDWHGPCLDGVSRYNKCTKCFCLDRDCQSREEYEHLIDNYYDRLQEKLANVKRDVAGTHL
jgi:hypothetical protein